MLFLGKKSFNLVILVKNFSLNSFWYVVDFAIALSETK